MSNGNPFNVNDDFEGQYTTESVNEDDQKIKDMQRMHKQLITTPLVYKYIYDLKMRLCRDISFQMSRTLRDTLEPDMQTEVNKCMEHAIKAFQHYYHLKADSKEMQNCMKHIKKAARNIYMFEQDYEMLYTDQNKKREENPSQKMVTRNPNDRSYDEYLIYMIENSFDKWALHVEKSMNECIH